MSTHSREDVDPEASGIGPFPASDRQREFFHPDGKGFEPHINNVLVCILVHGDTSDSNIVQAIDESIRRHSVLRSRYSMGRAGSLLATLDTSMEPRIGRVDMSMLPSWLRSLLLHMVFGKLRKRCFNQQTGPLLWGYVLRQSSREHCIALAVDHIVFDGWSIGVLIRDLRAFFNHSSEPRPTQNYFELSRAQHEWLSTPTAQGHLDYWKATLSDLFVPFWIPTDRIPFWARKHRARVRVVVIRQEQFTALRVLARELRVSLWMIMMAAFFVLLYRWTRQEDTMVATFQAGRSDSSLYEAIGNFYDIWPLRIRMHDSMRFSEVVRVVKERYLQALPHLCIPQSQIFRLFYETASEAASTPIFFNYVPNYGAERTDAALSRRPGDGDQRHARSAISVGGGQWEDRLRYAIDTRGKKLYFEVRENQFELNWRFYYGTTVLRLSTIRCLSDSLLEILEIIVRNPQSAVGELGSAVTTLRQM